MQDLLELAMRRIETLEKKLERYYMLLKIENELDFILKGTYVTTEDMNAIIEGTY